MLQPNNMVFIETGLPVCNLLKVKCKSYSVFERYSKTSLLKAETNLRGNFLKEKERKKKSTTNVQGLDFLRGKRRN